MGELKLYPPVPMTEAFRPAYLAGRNTLNRDEAFRLRDAQGMPDASGVKYHGGVDIFAPGGTPVCAPKAGIVRRAVLSDDRTGPVFGGVLVIQHADFASVMRHVNPSVPVGLRVQARQRVASVVDWLSGGDHMHYELWKGIPNTSNPWSDGYRLENCIDPATVVWDATVGALPLPQPVVYFLENVPFDKGGTGPKSYGPWAVWTDDLEQTYRRMREGRVVSRHLFGGRHWMLEWPPGTYNNPYIWAFDSKADREAGRARWESQLGVRLREYAGAQNTLHRHRKVTA